MNRKHLWISIISVIALVFLGCSSDDSSVSNDSGSQGTETSFNFSLTSVKKQETASSALGRQASFTADQVMTGQLTATNTDTSVQQVFDWSIYFDEDSYDVQSNKTIILPPGTYDFALLLTKGDQQYAGSVAGQAISDGTFDVPMTIRPIIGNTITDVTLVASLAEFKFQYDPAELSAASIVNPQMGITIGAGTEVIYGINPLSGISDTWINLDEGSNSIQLKLYDGSLQVGRSITAQETVIVSAGLNITMDLVALHGETTFALTEAGGDAHFSFNIPSDVVDEAGGLSNLEVLFQIMGINNPLDETVLTLAPDGSGDYEAFVTLSNKQFGDVTMALTFTDSVAGEILGVCNMPATLDTTERTLNCGVTLRRRAVIGGSLLATLGINVFNEADEAVAGVTVSENGNVLGITGSGAFGTEGYLKVYLNAGSYQIRAESSSMYSEIPLTLSTLGLTNQDITLGTDLTQNYTVPDTGQFVCYDGSGTAIGCPAPGSSYAQDGSYTINPQSYADNGDGTLTDNVTSLVWQKEDDGTTRVRSDARAYCSNLSLAGKYDWRLPNGQELMSIVNYFNLFPSIDLVFTNTTPSYYWTSEDFVVLSDHARAIHFGNGHFAYNLDTTPYYTRCVRGSELVAQNFQDNGDSTVTDSSTGLMWQQNEGNSGDWPGSLSYCESLSLAGYNDWRLPNYKELLSIVDFSIASPAINPVFFPNVHLDRYWSSTSYVTAPQYAWYIDFGNGATNGTNKTDIHRIRCVR